jgi:hypothetical protein
MDDVYSLELEAAIAHRHGNWAMIFMSFCLLNLVTLSYISFYILTHPSESKAFTGAVVSVLFVVALLLSIAFRKRAKTFYDLESDKLLKKSWAESMKKSSSSGFHVWTSNANHSWYGAFYTPPGSPKDIFTKTTEG